MSLFVDSIVKTCASLICALSVSFITFDLAFAQSKGGMPRKQERNMYLNCFYQSGGPVSGAPARYKTIHLSHRTITKRYPIRGGNINSDDGWAKEDQEIKIRYTDAFGGIMFELEGSHGDGPNSPEMPIPYRYYDKVIKELGIVFVRAVEPVRPLQLPEYQRLDGSGGSDETIEALITLEGIVYVYLCRYKREQLNLDLYYFK
ncbi:hypothetical protein EOJ32_19945 (plasmid) [Paracoccus sp. Arc7-R13]|uniref:hypothetical protein n=1 Tax=Paracoccus sp. Arc7-R13 TaxID=2500532 RepID=UPI000FD974B7|nr:hypothetical protein [Paracoccus sp. Arc7-R13]AZY96065.1 hypothetical protein EOJ32_19945 [Paracoccus sp. Arc7-R13]